ncbi:hypothetical protein D3C87_1223460 [compost metagenome]
MRVVQRHAHFRATVFEREHIGDAGPLGEFLRAPGPRLQQQDDVTDRQGAQRGAGILGEHHHFALAAGGRRGDRQVGRVVGAQRQGGKAVVEDRDIVVACRQLRRMCWIARGRQRVVLRRRQEGAALAIGRIRHPLAAQRMPAQVRIGFLRQGERARCNASDDDGTPTVKGQLAPVGFDELLAIHDVSQS